jgi:hypothetical protein
VDSAEGQENKDIVVDNFDRAGIFSRIANAPASINAAVSSALQRDMIVHHAKNLTTAAAWNDIQQLMAQQEMLELHFQREEEAKQSEEQEIEHASELGKDELHCEDNNQCRDEENWRRDDSRLQLIMVMAGRPALVQLPTSSSTLHPTVHQYEANNEQDNNASLNSKKTQPKWRRSTTT